jgi:putative DNA primase/helicase
MKIDFQQINDAALSCLESLVREWLPSGRREGHEWKVGSLSGEPGRSLSINMNSGAWKDFAGDAGGSDPVSLLAAIRNVPMIEAAREIGERLRTGITSEGVTSTAKDKPASWTPVVPVPENAPAPTFRHYRFGAPSKVWTYRDSEGRVIGHICRFDLPDGGKDVVPKCYAANADGKREWRWLSFAKPRPLYGLELLAANPKAGVLIVEGEKAADAARTIAPGVVVTWPGGGKAVRLTDWAPLAGRKVLIWPDQDLKAWTPEDEEKSLIPPGFKVGDLWPQHKQPGMAAALAIKSALEGIAASVRIVEPPSRPDNDGWDLADAVAEGWNRDAVVGHIRATGQPKPEESPPQTEEPPPSYENPEDSLPPWTEHIPDAQPKFRDDRISDMPFRLLGVDGDQFFYMPDRGHQIVSLSASSHSKNNLMRLAPLQEWEANFAAKGGADWDAAVNSLIQRSQILPKFDPRRIRGRGCWVDGQDVVFHAGDRLVVNGVESEIPRYNSHVRAIYEGALEIEVDSAEVAANRDSAKLIELCEMLSWERPLYGKMLAGWLAIAPVCGALLWRPHLWVTGPSGSGKSWTVANIIQPIVGKTAIHVQGNTSEAGIRGMLGSDALPVVFDEAESEDRASQLRFDKVLELARGASTETGAGVVKGTAAGGSVTYLIRSCFLFASIGVAAVKKADVSRVTVLPLRKNTGPSAAADFDRIKALWKETAASETYCERIRSRSLRFAKVLRTNCETFSTVAVEFTGDKRSADQIGTLLAGAFMLTSTREITREAAREWMANQDWTGFQAEDIDNDENQCLAHLFAANIRYEVHGKAVTRSVSETIESINAIPSHAADDELHRRAELKAAMVRHGMRLTEGRLYVANKHQQLERIFADTPWAGAKWRQQLSRIPGHEKHDVMTFGQYVRQRAVSLPME